MGEVGRIEWMSDEELVTIRAYAAPHEAYLAQSVLTVENVPARIGSEATALWLSYVGTALGGVKLLVAARDRERADEILRSYEAKTADAPAAAAADDRDEYESIPPSDADATRAWRAAIIGLIITPFAFYALYLTAKNLPQEVSPPARRWLIAALAISLVNLTVWAIAWSHFAAS